MKIKYLLKYSVVMILMILILLLVLSIFTYFFSYNKIIKYIYNLIVPLCLFVISLMYAKKSGEKGLLRGLEIWGVYFVIICMLKFTLANNSDINIIKHLIYMPINILGGILGVNLHR